MTVGQRRAMTVCKLSFRWVAAVPVAISGAFLAWMLVADPAGAAGAEPRADGPALYRVHCATCHGMNAAGTGVLADLRFSSRTVHDQFNRIVLDGVLSNVGMASFADLLNEEDVSAIHSYVIDTARKNRETQLNSAQ